MALVTWFVVVAVVGLLQSCDGKEITSPIDPISLDNGAQDSAEDANPSNQSHLANDAANNKSEIFDPQQSSYWLLQKSAGTVPDDSDRPFSHCNLRPVTWANITHGALIIPSRFGVDLLLRSSVGIKPFAFNQRSQSVPSAKHDCYILFLYSLDCPISRYVFPYMRSLARAYPQFRVYAVQIEDYMAHRWSLRMMFVPNIKLMVNGRVLREYSYSRIELDELVDFVWTNTRQLPKGPVMVHIEDLQEYPPEPVPKTNWCLIVSWITVLLSVFYLSVVCWDTATRHLMNVIHRASRGRYGYTQATNAHTGAMLHWVSGGNISTQ